MHQKENGFGIIVLAAGSSSRLGKPKQSLPYNHGTLLQHSIQVALDTKASQVVVVLGAQAATVRPAVKHERLFVVINEQWQEGMAASIRCGLQYLLDLSPLVQSAVCMACDQPYVTTALLDNLVTLQQSGKHAIAASEYASTTGIPAVFDRQLFPDLLQLTGDAGAKKLMMKHRSGLATIPFPLGHIDIDTPADYNGLPQP